MNIQTEKLSLIENLTKVEDAAVLLQIRHILGLTDDPIVGYEIDGKPITKSELNQSLKEAKKRFKAGRYTTQEGVEKEIKNW